MFNSNEQKKQRRMYNFEQNFEIGRLTGSGKVSAAMKTDTI